MSEPLSVFEINDGTATLSVGRGQSVDVTTDPPQEPGEVIVLIARDKQGRWRSDAVLDKEAARGLLAKLAYELET